MKGCALLKISMTLLRGKTAKIQKINNFVVSSHWNYTFGGSRIFIYLAGIKASPNRGCGHLFRLSKTLFMRIAVRFLTQIVCSGAQKNHVISRNHGSPIKWEAVHICLYSAPCSLQDRLPKYFSESSHSNCTFWSWITHIFSRNCSPQKHTDWGNVEWIL